MTTTTRVETIPPISRSEANALAVTEYGRLVDQLRSLAPEDWTKPTDCPLWDVRAMAGHSVGMLSDFTSLRSVMRRMRAATKAAKQTGSPMIDAMTAMQVTEHAELTTAELIEHAEMNSPRAARWRATAPALLRRIPMTEHVDGQPETWRIGYLLDIILTRDPWMHRVDIAHATGQPMTLTADHDGRIVADVVAEWARRHGQPFTLALTGPAGGQFTAGTDGERIELDAVEFCRTLSGRAAGSGLLARQVPF
ncbi:MAG TPA: maleylpyruvate isomerase family mycothiol-dependent enzyme [Ilumatobacter sp.]|nr:maleylpyruvate isomerase family mycothiol-dependent enzyme [Ilumatobacter sp.]